MACVASAYTGRTSYETHLAQLVAEYMGVKPKNICARMNCCAQVKQDNVALDG